MPNHLKIPVVCTKFAGCETGARAVPINKPLWTEDMSTTFSASLDRRNWTRIDNLKPVEQPKEYIGDSHGNLQLWAVLIIALGSVGFIGYLILGALCVVKRRKKQYAAAIEYIPIRFAAAIRLTFPIAVDWVLLRLSVLLVSQLAVLEDLGFLHFILRSGQLHQYVPIDRFVMGGLS